MLRVFGSMVLGIVISFMVAVGYSVLYPDVNVTSTRSVIIWVAIGIIATVIFFIASVIFFPPIDDDESLYGDEDRYNTEYRSD